MAVSPPDLDLDLTDLASADWHARLDDLGEEHGFYQKVGPDHAALFIEAGPRLLVTFEQGEAVRRGGSALPQGFDLVTRNNWSLLSILSESDGWFRDPALYAFFDRQTDDGFLEDFERTLFFGHHQGGHAAAAYSVAAPGARVLALRPLATLDPSVAGWERRFLRDRRLDFNTRYGYAPEMLDAAEAAFVVHDPLFAPDAMQAALFRRPNVTLLPTPLAGGRIAAMFDAMEITAPLLEAAMEGNLTPASFGRLWRARRENAAYLRILLKRTETEGRPGLAARVCRFGLTTRDAPLFARKLAEMGLSAETAPQSATTPDSAPLPKADPGAA